jgi:hypothetical protein
MRDKADGSAAGGSHVQHMAGMPALLAVDGDILES